MIDVAETLKQYALVTFALLAASMFTHKQLSTMLVERGDIAVISRPAHASTLYRRALMFDSNNRVALDRLLTSALLSHNPRELDGALAAADRYMKGDRIDPDIRMDRALCEQVLHRYRAAASDFELVGVRRRDPRALLFAADDEAHLGNRARAVEVLRWATRWAPAFPPARLALQRIADS